MLKTTTSHVLMASSVVYAENVFALNLNIEFESKIHP